MILESAVKHETGPSLKKKLFHYLKRSDFKRALADIGRLPPRKTVNPLIRFLCNEDDNIKWRAVIAMGEVVYNLAQEDLEASRNIVRRLIWSLNDESGAIGWGAPEAMGQIMARHATLAREYWQILISYIRPGPNYLEHEQLQKGALWGIGTLANCRPSLLRGCVQWIHPYMESTNADLRGLALLAAGPLAEPTTTEFLHRLCRDSASISVYRNDQLVQYNICELAAELLRNVGEK